MVSNDIQFQKKIKYDYIQIPIYSMDFFKATMQNVASFANNYNSNKSKPEILRQQLYHCTYSDDSKFVIEKSVKQVLHVYPHFETEILTFSEGNQQKRYIEIKGIMDVEVRGKNCKVDYNMMIPNGFPRKPPYVRIVNHKSEYIVDSFYKELRSPTDPKSFILNEKLQNVKSWNETSSLVNIVIQSHDMMRSKFPFSKSKTTQQDSYGSQGNSGWNNVGNQSGWNTGNNQGWNNQGYNNQGFNNQGYNNQGQNQGQNQGWNQGNQGFNQGFNQNMGGMGGFNQPKPPIPFNQTNSLQIIAQNQKFVGESKKIFNKLKTDHLQVIEKNQHLVTIHRSLESQQKYLQHQNAKMSEFLRQSESSGVDNLSSLIKPNDQLSEQILDLNSSMKAHEQCISLLENKFNDEEITFEEFIKNLRKMQEQKFEERVLLAKCVGVAQAK